MTRAHVDQHSHPFEEFINQQLYWGDEVFTPITPPAPTDPRWHYGQYQAAEVVRIYSQPDSHFSYLYSLRPTKGFAHALLRYLPDIRPGWTAIALTVGSPMIGYVRNDVINFRRSSGIYEYIFMFLVSAQIVIGLSVLIFLYTMPKAKTQASGTTQVESSPIEQYVERFVARLEGSLLPLQ